MRRPTTSSLAFERALWGEPGLSAAEKVYAWNTFEILAFRTGNPDNPVNSLRSDRCEVDEIATFRGF